MLNRLIKYIRRYGIRKTYKSIGIFAITYLKSRKLSILSGFQALNNKKTSFLNTFSVDYKIHKRRVENSRKLWMKLKGRVGYGPFKGVFVSWQKCWSLDDIGNMLLGLYEKEVTDILVSVKGKYKTLVDLGAADGYYAVGCLRNNIYKQAYCYELSTEGRRNIMDNAKLNHVSSKVQIFGLATIDFYRDLQNLGVNLSDCVILCDIEGGEFDLFRENTLKQLRSSVVIIEIHDWHENGKSKYERLKKHAEKYFKVFEVTTGKRDLSVFPEIREMRDNDRWLLVSEGRHYLQTWLVLKPKGGRKQ